MNHSDLGELALAQAGSQGGLQAFLPLVLILAVFYFLLIRPQMKRQKEHKALVENLKRNDAVVTTGGLHGRIVDVADKTVVLEIAQNVKVRYDKEQVGALQRTGKEG